MSKQHCTGLCPTEKADWGHLQPLKAQHACLKKVGPHIPYGKLASATKWVEIYRTSNLMFQTRMDTIKEGNPRGREFHTLASTLVNQKLNELTK